jgi:hypothetical protein
MEPESVSKKNGMRIMNYEHEENPEYFVSPCFGSVK